MRIQNRTNLSEYISRPPYPLRPAVRTDRGQDHEPVGGGAHVQGRDNPQGRLNAGPPSPHTQPVL